MKRTIYYRDPVNDDFAGNHIQTKRVPADFPFAPSGPLWQAGSFLLYRCIATPLVWLIGKLGFGLRIKNRRVLRQLRKSGFYLYGNHTQQMMDAYIPTLCCFPHRAYIVTGPDAVSIPGLRRVVQLLGAIPLPGELAGFRPFLAALRQRTEERAAVCIYPEAHIWPWYTGIRPFPDGSFAYPVRQQAPVLAFTTTFRQRKLLRFLWPCLTVTLSEPFYPDPTLPPHEAKKQLRDQVYKFMCRTAGAPDNYEYICYRQQEE